MTTTAKSKKDNKINSKSTKKVITPDMGVDQELIDFGKKVLAKAIIKRKKTNKQKKKKQSRGLSASASASSTEARIRSEGRADYESYMV